ncbi:hypothetical protein [Caulobacter endophyticus]|uniref:hypothetical protein n=1 Tax=Caulobacter endophyticus TaxID=2172652 RepID=UPI00240F1468|nr:hypothetical protein [Caulobacter endophyticus]MDG2531016.1 hypothetical protein [Caulobacter endophyticus]
MVEEFASQCAAVCSHNDEAYDRKAYDNFVTHIPHLAEFPDAAVKNLKIDAYEEAQEFRARRDQYAESLNGDWYGNSGPSMGPIASDAAVEIGHEAILLADRLRKFARLKPARSAARDPTRRFLAARNSKIEHQRASYQARLAAADGDELALL